jgi:hypothetical protein
MDNTRLSEISNYFKPKGILRVDMDGTTLNLVLGPGRQSPFVQKEKMM